MTSPDKGGEKTTEEIVQSMRSSVVRYTRFCDEVDVKQALDLERKRAEVAEKKLFEETAAYEGAITLYREEQAKLPSTDTKKVIVMGWKTVKKFIHLRSLPFEDALIVRLKERVKALDRSIEIGKENWIQRVNTLNTEKQRLQEQNRRLREALEKNLPMLRYFHLDYTGGPTDHDGNRPLMPIHKHEACGTCDDLISGEETLSKLKGGPLP